jgi:sulfur carrier protein ThiS adenylyltransferase
MHQEKIKNCRVGVAGCGGLGSNAAIALIRCGLGNVTIVDFDVIVESNLNRQYFFRDQIGLPKVDAFKTNALRINSSCNIETHCLRITPENVVSLFSNCNVIIEALDRAEEKIMLIESLIQKLPDIPIVVGSGLGGWGKTSEIRCKQMGNIVLCGDTTTDVGDGFPPLAPRVGIVANMQANETLRLLMEK